MTGRSTTVDVDVAVVGGGPAGAVTAALLARRGVAVTVLERTPAWRWRACGVFASPAALARLDRLGLATAAGRAAVLPIAAMRVEAPRAPAFRLTYGAGDDGGGGARPTAVGFDRAVLDEALLAAARDAGADVRRGVNVGGLEEDDGVRLRVRDAAGERTIRARIVVGADGIRSVVARSVGVARPARLAPRVGLTFHLADPAGDVPRDARMCLLADGYVGVAPVPGGRVNVGIVLGRSWHTALRGRPVAEVTRGIVAQIRDGDGQPAAWRHGPVCDSVEGAAPIGHRVARRAGDAWLLVGDAAGFLDPFTGEGLHRAIVSAELAAGAVDCRLRGGAGSGDALPAYERAMAGRFRSKDLVSAVVQGFLARPTVFSYAARRLAARERVRETMGLVIGDLVPASRALDPRFLAALLRP